LLRKYAKTHQCIIQKIVRGNTPGPPLQGEGREVGRVWEEIGEGKGERLGWGKGRGYGREKERGWVVGRKGKGKGGDSRVYVHY